MSTPLATSARAERSAIAFRPIANDDREFLLRVYAGTRSEELAQVPWSDAQKAQFLAFQFEAQHRHYHEHYPDAAFLVISHRGVPAGRLYVDRGAEDIRLIDIALLPEHRALGIGALLISELIEEARGAGKSLSIHVEQFNPAQRLYLRLGFRPIAQHGLYLLMEWRAEGALAAQ